MKNFATAQWTEIGIVVNENTGIAAVGVSSGCGKPLPSVQLGRVIGPERRFSPYLHPAVDWKDGKGKISNRKLIGQMPKGLQDKIAQFLAPHLVERPGQGIDELLGHEIVDVGRKVQGETVLDCLSCSQAP